MSTDRDVDRIVRSWLEEGVTALPDRVLDNVLDRLPATPQRWSWWPARRLHEMNTPLRMAMAAAAVVVLALVGVNLFPKAGGIGGPLATPAPTASPTPTASPPPTTPPSPTPTPTVPSASGGAVTPGTYRMDFITLTVPAGWTSPDGYEIGKPDSGPPNGMYVNTWRNISWVYNDPCHWKTTPVGVRTVDAVAAAFAAGKHGAPVTPVDITISGFHGKQVDLMVPLDVDISKCDDGYYRMFTLTDGGERYNQGPGQHDILDILEVDGQIFVVKLSYWQANTAADLAELRAIGDSIRITP